MQRESAPVLLCCASCGIEHQSSVHTFLSFLKKNQTLIWIANRFPSLFKVISPKSVYIVTLTVTRFRSAPFLKSSLSLRRTFLVINKWMWWWACLRRWTLVRRETENNLFFSSHHLFRRDDNQRKWERDLYLISTMMTYIPSPERCGATLKRLERGRALSYASPMCCIFLPPLFFSLKFPFVFKRVEQEQMVGNNIGTPAGVYIQESFKKRESETLMMENPERRRKSSGERTCI